MNQQTIESINASMQTNAIDALILQDPDTIEFLTGFTGYLGMEFARPTILILTKDNASGSTTLVTPLCESLMASRAVPAVSIKSWADDQGWWPVLKEQLPKAGTLGVQRNLTHVTVLDKITSEAKDLEIKDCSHILDPLRMVKTPQDLEKMAKVGQVATAILDGCRRALRPGIAEWEAVLEATRAGTRKAAELMEEDAAKGMAPLPGESPVIGGVPILQSSQPGCAKDIDAMLCVHQKAGLKRVEQGDHLYLCCCNLSHYRGMHLGFDRTFFVGEPGAEMRRLCAICDEQQMAALEAIKPGAICEDVHAASMAVLTKHGIAPGYRTGRSCGYARLELPELKAGDKTVIQEGMCLVVDGGVSMPGVGTVRNGDTVRVTATGYEILTPYPKNPIIIEAHGTKRPAEAEAQSILESIQLA